jgi:Immunity protein 39
MMDVDKRALLVGAVSLMGRRLKLGGQAGLIARNEIEPELIKHGYLREASFKTISLILRYGDKDNLNPEIGVLDANNSELPVTVMLDMKKLESLDLDALVAKLRSVMLEVLCDVAANFDLPHKFLDDMHAPGFKKPKRLIVGLKEQS